MIFSSEITHILNNSRSFKKWMASWKNRTSRYFFFSAHHSMVFYFRCSVHWCWGSVRF